VRSDLAANSTLLSTATLISDAALAAGDTGIASGGSIAEALEALFGDTVDFDAAGTLGAPRRRFPNMPRGSLDIATKSSTATSEAETAAWWPTT
jgi:hypothetical protein